MNNPDFVGNWVFSEPWIDIMGYGDFRMFISERIRLADSILIKGTIEDRFGSATFDGSLSDNEISFTKKYSKEAIERGAAPDRVEYRGTSKNGKYTGKFTVINGITNGQRGNWSGDFFIARPDYVLQN